MRKASYNGSDTQRVGNKTMTVGSNFRFENFQRLNSIVGEISQRNKQSTVKNGNKLDMSGKVLDMIKNRIKTNCQRLYENYDENKKVILKQIQQVETNMLSENAISKGFQSIVKQKSSYDKAKTELQAKQKKLKKLIEVRDQLKQSSTQSTPLIDILNQKSSLLQQFQQYKKSLDYQTSVLNNMKSHRRQVKLYLKQKYDRMLADQQFKKQRIKKLENLNHIKKMNLKKIEEELKRQEHCEIPQQLAGQLQRKLQQYEGKFIYQNIAKHQNIITQQFRRQSQLQQARQKQEQRRLRTIKQKSQQKQYELAYNFYLIKQQQEEKIKRICGVNSLSQILNNSLQADCQNLQTIKKQTQKAIKQIRQKNKIIYQQIEDILTGKNQNQHEKQDDLLEIEKEFIKSQKELKGLEINALKKYEMLDQWHRLVQMMTGKQIKKQQIGDSLKNIFQTIVVRLQTTNNQKNIKMNTIQLTKDNKIDNSLISVSVDQRKSKLKTQQQSEYSIIDKSFI